MNFIHSNTMIKNMMKVIHDKNTAVEYHCNQSLIIDIEPSEAR
jgi:hypothetical protein